MPPVLGVAEAVVSDTREDLLLCEPRRFPRRTVLAKIGALADVDADDELRIVDVDGVDATRDCAAALPNAAIASGATLRLPPLHEPRAVTPERRPSRTPRTRVCPRDAETTIITSLSVEIVKKFSGSRKMYHFLKLLDHRFVDDLHSKTVC